ncbi:MAG: Multidrug resistance protein MdtA [Phycisphaerae bacterium]|nr:Multidrug resistance protein MdtA [Phycisphaerae bacterium]
MRRAHSIISLLAVLALLMLGTLIYLLWQLKQHPSNTTGQTILTSTTQPTSQEAEPAEPQGFTGVIIARQVVDVAPKFQGELAEVRVDIGQRVDAGTIVARLTATELEQRITVAEKVLKAAQLEVVKAQAQLDEATARLERRKKLQESFAPEEITEAELYKKVAESQLSVSEANVARQEAEITLLKEQLADCAVKAPFAGTISIRYRDPGSIVAPGIPILRLITHDDLWVRFAVPELIAGQLSAGVEVLVSKKLTPEIRCLARVEHVAPEIDSYSRLIHIEARLLITPEQQALFPAGTEVEIEMKPPAASIPVP